MKSNTKDKGAGAIGGAIGAAVGLIGGPLGSIGGAVVGSVLTDVFKDMAARKFSERERIRYDSATEYVIDGFKENIQAGLIVRQDGFFEGEHNYSSDAAQLLEGVLSKCKAQYQEKKVQLIANIFKNVAYNSHISPQTAYQVLSIADRFTYQDICVIAYYGRKQEQELKAFPFLRERFCNYPHVNFSEATLAMAQILHELHTIGILEDPDGNTYGHRSVIAPTVPILSSRGNTIFTMLELQKVLVDDILTELRPLEFQSNWGVSASGSINGVKVSE